MGQFADGTRHTNNGRKTRLKFDLEGDFQEHAALLKNRLYRRWGIKAAREYARIKIDGLLPGGKPDFTNALGHGDDAARFYDRQQAYVHARGG